ncbi:trans-sialidase [Trypanosoma conorhini]|uniref:Trans-sialidase n=1 Tax=Trypanosoma conorhini TaxID=83891 RepID=A0A3R7LMJ3_9TRYP|nr:trans-sialidase [Trypanosoma conorhini]RNF27606.1 trans-sialidase [Trypanosoma conorhini]
MPRHLFPFAVLPLLLCALMCCGSSGAGTSVEGARKESKEVELFKQGETPVLAAGETGDKDRYQGVSSFFSHSLLDVNGVLVALAVGKHNGTQQSMGFDTWAKSNAYGADEKLKEDATWAKQEWKTQRVTKQVEGEVCYRTLFGPKALVKDSKIYLLVSKTVAADTSSSREDNWDLALIVGDVPGPVAEQGRKAVAWGEPRSLKSALAAEMTAPRPWEDLEPSRGARGVAVGAATILFPLAGTTNDGTGTLACTVVYSDDNGSSWKLHAAGAIAQGCEAATLLEWAGKLFMATLNSSYSRHGKVYGSSDEGKTWNEAAGPFARLLGDAYALSMNHGGSDLISATIEKRSVLLYTTTLLSRTEPGGTSGRGTPRRVIHLWLSDGARTHDVGPISADDAGAALFSSLLYTKDELFALYTKKGDTSDILVFARLPEQLQRIKAVLNKWKDVDARVATLCSSAATTAAACVGAMPTDGLVGFLSNGGDNTHWKDEYLGVGATVLEGATKVDDGFALAGRGASIVWPVGGDEDGPGHSSVGEEVTLVATVTINEAPKGATPLLGVRTMITGSYLGLWYDEHKHWRTKLGAGAENNAETIAWEEGEAYRVVLTVKNGSGSAYVDGRLVGSLKKRPATVTARPSSVSGEPQLERPSERVSQIFFGGYRGSEPTFGGRVTLTNVLLYNRRFSASEVAALKRAEERKSSGAAGAQHAKAKAKDISVRGCASGALSLLPLGLWGLSALC